MFCVKDRQSDIKDNKKMAGLERTHYSDFLPVFAHFVNKQRALRFLPSIL